MADVAAKDGSQVSNTEKELATLTQGTLQETLMNLVGLIVNLVITPMVAQSQL